LMQPCTSSTCCQAICRQAHIQPGHERVQLLRQPHRGPVSGGAGTAARHSVNTLHFTNLITACGKQGLVERAVNFTPPSEGKPEAQRGPARVQRPDGRVCPQHRCSPRTMASSAWCCWR
jgi:hypothetical protein